MPWMVLQQVRGDLFFDIGGAKLNGQPCTFRQNGRLAIIDVPVPAGKPPACGAASIGYGLSFNMLGLELHWDFAKHTDLKQSYGKYRTEFWIGETF